MAATEQAGHVIGAASSGQEADEDTSHIDSARAIADRILGTNDSLEMTDMLSGQLDGASNSVPTSTDPRANTVPAVLAVTDAALGAAPPLSADTSSRAQESEPAGGAVSIPHPQTQRQNPGLILTIILPSTDSRHRFVINESYLARRAVEVRDGVVTNLTVYNLKELIYQDWRQDWETRPSNPSYIRLIHMGRMLEDNSYLKDNRFQVGDTPHVVHMTVKPSDIGDDDDGRIGKTSSRRTGATGEERTPGCRCVVM